MEPQKPKVKDRSGSHSHPHAFPHTTPYEVFFLFPQDLKGSTCHVSLRLGGRQCKSSYNTGMNVNLLIFCIKNKYKWQLDYILPYCNRLSHIQGVWHTPLEHCYSWDFLFIVGTQDKPGHPDICLTNKEGWPLLPFICPAPNGTSSCSSHGKPRALAGRAWG